VVVALLATAATANFGVGHLEFYIRS
jgi:hypothetical protein